MDAMRIRVTDVEVNAVIGHMTVEEFRRASKAPKTEFLAASIERFNAVKLEALDPIRVQIVLH